MQVIKPGSLTLQHGISMYVCNLRRMPKWKIQTYHLSDFFFSQLTTNLANIVCHHYDKMISSSVVGKKYVPRKQNTCNSENHFILIQFEDSHLSR